ncbi:MAG: hypothetical protein K2L35_03140 [Muribaculaceae bacterium]|nr:hypothetical protein [Muribaculaceae bacterium]MDE5957061.1 hypothetical protein [Muribaculaceae bacterium]MDE6447295.1 hypothetical protein [Muribaculaceae bacterium]
MKKILLPMVLLLICGACGGKGEKTMEASEEDAAQIEAAIILGRGDARRIINRTFNDSMAFHAALLEANAHKSAYQLDQRPRCAAAYDSAFISTIRTTRPDLARMLEQR